MRDLPRTALPPAGRGSARRIAIASSALEFERYLELGAVGLDLARGIQLQVEQDDFSDTKIPKGLAGPVDRRRGGLFPGVLAGTDQFDDLVDAFSHVVLPFGVRQDAGGPAAGKPNTGISALKGCGAPCRCLPCATRRMRSKKMIGRQQCRPAI